MIQSKEQPAVFLQRSQYILTGSALCEDHSESPRIKKKGQEQENKLLETFQDFC